jgi:hypothetical protein
MTIRALPLIALCLTVAGCTYEGDDDHYDCGGNCGPYDYTPTDPESSSIDTGAELAEIEAGEGAGAFIEYQADGAWHVFTACDTNVSTYACSWDVIVSAIDGNQLVDYGSDRLETEDYVGQFDSNSIQFIGITDYDFDGFFVQTDPGGHLRVDVYLDGAPAPRFIYWVGNGGLHKGSPTNPIDLLPTDP